MAPLQHNIPRIIAIGQLFILLQEAEALVLQHGQEGGVRNALKLAAIGAAAKPAALMGTQV